MNETSQASLYGRGVFTTVAIYDRQPFLWDKHWLRLTNNARRLGIDLNDLSEDMVRQALANAVERDNIVNGRLRITFFDERPSTIWPTETEGHTRLSIITAGVRTVPENLRLTVSPYPVNSRSPLAGVKSCNYLENILALDEAKERGSDEAIRLNERGHMTSACMANVFWLRGDQLHTPSLSTGCLPGTTREFVLENVECDEVEAGIDEIRSADAIFLSSAGLGVVAVNEFDGRRLADRDHDILRLIPKAD